jgi:hypothetical protein
MVPILDAAAVECFECAYVKQVYEHILRKKFGVKCENCKIEEAQKIRRILFLVDLGCEVNGKLWNEILAFKNRICSNYTSTCTSCT